MAKVLDFIGVAVSVLGVCFCLVGFGFGIAGIVQMTKNNKKLENLMKQEGGQHKIGSPVRLDANKGEVYLEGARGWQKLDEQQINIPWKR